MHVRALRLLTLLEKTSEKKVSAWWLALPTLGLASGISASAGLGKGHGRSSYSLRLPVIRPGCLANLDAQTSIFNGLMVKLTKRTQKDPTPNRKSEITTQAVESCIRLQ